MNLIPNNYAEMNYMRSLIFDCYSVCLWVIFNIYLVPIQAFLSMYMLIYASKFWSSIGFWAKDGLIFS